MFFTIEVELHHEELTLATIPSYLSEQSLRRKINSPDGVLDHSVGLKIHYIVTYHFPGVAFAVLYSRLAAASSNE